MPEISVIMPAYNTGKYIKKAICSVMDQTFSDFELIIIEQNSTDDTLAVIKKLCEKDERIKLITSDIRNPGSARNIGIMAATGKYLAFVDSDDYIEINMLEILLNVIIKNDSDIAYCTFYIDNHKTGAKEMYCMPVVPEGAYRLLDRLDTFDNLHCHVAWNKLYKRVLIVDHGGFFPNFPINEDLVFIFKNFLNARSIEYIDTPLYHHLIYRPLSATDVVNPDAIVCLMKAVDSVIEYYKTRGVYNACKHKIAEVTIRLFLETIKKEYVYNSTIKNMDAILTYLDKTFPGWKDILNTDMKIMAAYKNMDILDKALNKKINFSGRDVILFSASTGGRALLSAFKAGGITVTAFCDNSSPLQNTRVDDVEVLSPETAVKRYGKSGYFIIAADVKYNAGIKNQLRGLGVDDENIY